MQVACLSNLPIRIIGEVESGQMIYFWEMIFALILFRQKSLCILIFITNHVRHSKLPFHLIIGSSFLFHITSFILFSSFHGSGQDTSSIKAENSQSGVSASDGLCLTANPGRNHT